MKHVKSFNTTADYNDYMKEQHFCPNVSYCRDTQIVHYNDVNVETVDFGLPSGTLWMKYNLGSNSLTDIGLGYQFGWGPGCSPNQHATGHALIYDVREQGSWDTVIGNNTSGSFDRSYWSSHYNDYFEDSDYLYDGHDMMTLKLKYDCVYFETAGKCRIPTIVEWKELLDSPLLTKTWYDDYDNSGVAGLEISRDDVLVFFPTNHVSRYIDGRIAKTCTYCSSSYIKFLIADCGGVFNCAHMSNNTPDDNFLYTQIYGNEYIPVRGVRI